MVNVIPKRIYYFLQIQMKFLSKMKTYLLAYFLYVVFEQSHIKYETVINHKPNLDVLLGVNDGVSCLLSPGVKIVVLDREEEEAACSCSCLRRRICS